MSLVLSLLSGLDLGTTPELPLLCNCPEDKFNCGHGRCGGCIDQMDVCDGNIHCYSGMDEENW